MSDSNMVCVIHVIQLHVGAVVAVFVWQLDLQLPMQSVPITTDVVSSNLDQGKVYNIIKYSLSVTCDTSVVFSGPLGSGLLHQ